MESPKFDQNGQIIPSTVQFILLITQVIFSKILLHTLKNIKFALTFQLQGLYVANIITVATDNLPSANAAQSTSTLLTTKLDIFDNFFNCMVICNILDQPMSFQTQIANRISWYLTAFGVLNIYLLDHSWLLLHQTTSTGRNYWTMLALIIHVCFNHHWLLPSLLSLFCILMIQYHPCGLDDTIRNGHRSAEL